MHAALVNAICQAPQLLGLPVDARGVDRIVARFLSGRNLPLGRVESSPFLALPAALRDEPCQPRGRKPPRRVPYAKAKGRDCHESRGRALEKVKAGLKRSFLNFGRRPSTGCNRWRGMWRVQKATSAKQPAADS